MAPRKPPYSGPRSIVYCVAAADCWKIGRTKYPPTRFTDLKRELGPIEMVHQIESSRLPWLEMYLHRVFRSKHLGRERFALTPADVELIRSIPAVVESEADLPAEIVARHIVSLIEEYTSRAMERAHPQLAEVHRIVARLLT